MCQIFLPLWRIRVDFASDLDVSNDFGLEQWVETDCPHLTGTSFHLAEESPLVTADRRKVAVFDPTPPLVRMASPSPTTQHFHQSVIHIAKGIRTDNMTVIHRPTTQKRVEQKHQMSGCRLRTPFHDPAYLFQQGRDVAFGGLKSGAYLRICERSVPGSRSLPLSG